MATRVKDMTSGKPSRLIFTFAIPLMLGNMCQQLYSMVDTIVVGQGVGVEALAALGAADWLNWMILGIIMGFTQGFSILVSQKFGSQNADELRKSVAMSFKLGILMAVVLTILSLVFAKPILLLLNTPSNIINQSLTYLRIVFSGIIVITFYNLFSSILRALGDSKTPLYAMIIAALINIALDLLFVMVFQMGVAGAAIATVIAQIFSSIFCFNVLRKIDILKMHKEDWKLELKIVQTLVRLGSLTAFQNIVISVGGMVVQSVVNGFGFIFVAGFTATNKLYGLLELAGVSFGYSVATFVGQNLGAKEYDRVRKGTKVAWKINVSISIVLALIMVPFGKVVLHLFVSGDPTQVSQVLAIAYKYLLTMCLFLPVLYTLHIYRSSLQGMGDTFWPMVSGIAELVMRVLVAIFLPMLLAEDGIYYAEITAWIGAVSILLLAYRYKDQHLEELY
ncbi:MAG: MATE family efflux transporter [Erysipelotrichaceae bacterium]|nr:MATE family efflux transporter [Erysipelotrichaceae bacterium]